MATPQNRFRFQPEWLVAVLVTIFIAWLHFFFLFHAGGLWRDEVNLVNLANRHSLSDMAKDSFPVLMPLLVKGWTATGLGQNDLSLRILGTLIGIGIIAALWVSALQARRPPLFSLMLVGLNAGVIFYGDSVRGYGLGCLLIILAYAAMLTFLKNPSWPRMVIFATTAILSVQALYQNTVLVAAICGGAWCVCWQQKNFQAAIKIGIAAMAAAISLLPYLHNIFGLSGVSDPLRVGFSSYVAFINFNQLAAHPLQLFTYIWGILAYGLLALSLLALHTHYFKSHTLRKKKHGDILVIFGAATMLVALLGFAGFLWFAARQTQPWYFVPLAGLVALCFDTGIPVMAQAKWIRAAILGTIMATAFLAMAMAERNLNLRFTNIDELAKQLNRQASPEDFVLVSPWFCGISFERYSRSNLTWQTVPPMTDHSVHRYDLLVDGMKTPAVLEPLFNQMTITLQSGHRVWLISSPGFDAMKIPKDSQSHPVALPPPPLHGSGWSEVPYCANWAAQTAWFLKHNSAEFINKYDVSAASNISRYESMQLFVASGWKRRPTGSNAIPSR